MKWQWALLPIAVATILIHNHWNQIPYKDKLASVIFVHKDGAEAASSKPKLRDVYYKCSAADDECRFSGAKRECDSYHFLVVGYEMSDDLLTKTFHARCDTDGSEVKKEQVYSIRCDHVGDYACLEERGHNDCLGKKFTLDRWEFGPRNNDASLSIDYIITCKENLP